MVVGCAFWGLDSNLTRNIVALDPSTVAQLKGLTAGAVNLLPLLAAGGSLPSWPSALAALAVGGLSYGISLVLFVRALRYLGSTRTSAYFGGGAVLRGGHLARGGGFLPSLGFLLAAVFMLIGTLLMVSEQHVHEHEHDGVLHTHWHLPDTEHRHSH